MRHLGGAVGSFTGGLGLECVGHRGLGLGQAVPGRGAVGIGCLQDLGGLSDGVEVGPGLPGAQVASRLEADQLAQVVVMGLEGGQESRRVLGAGAQGLHLIGCGLQCRGGALDLGALTGQGAEVAATPTRPGSRPRGWPGQP